MSDEPRRSVRATKGQHTKSLDLLDQSAEPVKKRGSKKSAGKKEEVATVEEEEEEEEEEIIRCICGVTEQDDESDEDWIACETCSAWQHNICMGVTTDSALLDSLHYWCEQCKPEDHKELLDGIAQGKKPWEERRRAYEQAEIEAQKAKKGKKGKSKRASDQAAEVVQNGKAAQAEPPADVKKEKEKEKEKEREEEKEKEKEKDKKEVVSRSGSTKRKVRDEPAEDPPKLQAKLRKVSTPQPKPLSAQETAPQTATSQNTILEGAGPADIPTTIEELDKVRGGVAKLMYKNLLFSMKRAVKNETYKAVETELDGKALRLALEIERATHDTHADQAEYTTQGRRVAANLKTNQELCDGLLSNSLTSSALAIMTDDEMASKELQRQTAEMKARAEKQSIMVTDDGPRIRRTHKGDEVIEEDNFTAPLDEPPSKRRRSMLDPNAGMGARSRENSDDENELPQDHDDYRSQDDIRGNAAPTAVIPLTVDTRSSPPARKASVAGDFDLNKVLSSVRSPTVPKHNRKPSAQLPTRDGPGEDPEIDKLLEDGNDSPPYSPTAYDADPTIIWRGTLCMNSIVADFPAVARHIGGADLNMVTGNKLPWSDLLPQRLQVAGRIEQEKANEYLCSLRYSTPTDVVVLALTPTGEVASVEFTKLFDYFHSKKRYGVVGNKGLANVRDTYIVPVPSGVGNVPEFLLNLENNKLPDDRAEPQILVALAIRHEIVPQVENAFENMPSPSIINHPQRQMSIGGYSGPGMSPIAPQGAFSSPATPQVQLSTADQQQADAERQRLLDDQARGEAVAHQVLGHYVSAPTVNFLLPQAHKMQEVEWKVIRETFEQQPRAQDDLAFLSQLLAQKNAVQAQSK